MNQVPTEGVHLDEVDRSILRELSEDGRMPYKELAARVGLAVSTCHGRVRALERAGVIRGYRAEIEAGAIGHAVEALISLTVSGRLRSEVPAVAETLRRVPGVQRVFLIGGDRDIVLHVACASVGALRELIATHIGTEPSLEQSQTHLVFEHLHGYSPL